MVEGERIVQVNEIGRFAGRVSINTTQFTSKLVISRTNYGDSGVYQFSDLEPLFGSAAINFSVSLPPRDIQSEFAAIHLQPQYSLDWARFIVFTASVG